MRAFWLSTMVPQWHLKRWPSEVACACKASTVANTAPQKQTVAIFALIKCARVGRYKEDICGR